MVAVIIQRLVSSLDRFYIMNEMQYLATLTICIASVRLPISGSVVGRLIGIDPTVNPRRVPCHYRKRRYVLCDGLITRITSASRRE